MALKEIFPWYWLYEKCPKPKTIESQNGAGIGTICLFVTVGVLLCSTACNSHRYIECEPGFNGKHCEIECALCEKGLCSLDGCTEGCIDGYFSNNNTKSCEKCRKNCASCISWQNCISCVSGYRGRSCEHTCNWFCHNATCDKTTGECTHGCKNLYYKVQLQCLRCPPCRHCSTNECTASCCEKMTRPVCAVKRCKTCITNKPLFCAQCLNAYYITNNGSCELCSTKCKYKTCHQHDGTCIYGCIDGWKGLHCKESAYANNSFDLYSINQRETGNQDEPGENSMVIGVGIGSTIVVLVVVVITTIILVRRKMVQQKPNAPIQNEALAIDASIHHNITSGSNNRSVLETTNQNTEVSALPGTYEYVDVDNIDITLNTYEALGKRDEHLYAKSTYEALGPRDEHVYSKSSYEELGACNEYTYGRVGESIYVNKTGMKRF